MSEDNKYFYIFTSNKLLKILSESSKIFIHGIFSVSILGWPPFGHESIEHEPLTALEQWKAFRHRSLWLVVSN